MKKRLSPATPGELARNAVLLFGKYWQTDLAKLLGVSPRLVRWWAAGDRPIPDRVMPQLREALRDRAEEIARTLRDVEG